MHRLSTTYQTPRWSTLAGLLRQMRWVGHPITIFVTLQVAWLATLLIWVIWFVGQRQAIEHFAPVIVNPAFDTKVSLAILIAGCVLLGMICVGTVVLFVFGQKQAVRARHQRNFVSSVTHELKSPLASLQLTLETIAAHKLDEKTTKRLMDMAHSDIDRLRRLVDQILVAGRIERGTFGLSEEDETVKIADVFSEVIEKTSYLDPRLRQRVAISCPPDLAATTSSAAILLVLSNLVENAVKYSPKSAPITLRASAASGGALHLEIADQGIGLEPAEIRRLFKMFQRGEQAVRRAIPGTGLGLYIVRSLIRRLGGNIWAESKGRDQGTVFHVMIPAIVSTAAGDRPIAPSAGAGAPAAPGSLNA